MISIVESCLNSTFVRTIGFVSVRTTTRSWLSGTSLAVRWFVCDSEQVAREAREARETQVTLTSPSLLLHMKLHLQQMSVNNNRTSLQNSYTVVQHIVAKSTGSYRLT